MKEFKIAISCGESSGDLNASLLIRELKKKYNNLCFYGLGGKNLKDAGCNVLWETDKFGTIGVIQSLKVILRLTYIYFRFKHKLKNEKPDVLLCVDFGFFNSKLIKAMAKEKINIVYYFPPASWRKNLKSSTALVESKSKVITPFPWSEKILTDFGLEAKFLGHPILDIAKPNESKDNFFKNENIPNDSEVLGFLPGSRLFEIKMHLPTFADTIKKLHKENRDRIFLIATSERYSKYIENKLKVLCHEAFYNIRIITNQVYNIMAYSKFLFCCSGTATLEAAVINTPMVIVYKGTLIMKFEYAIRKNRLPKIIGLPNIILNKYVVPELINNQVSSNNLIKAYKESLSKTETIKEDFNTIKNMLGTSPILPKIAETFANMANITDG